MRPGAIALALSVLLAGCGLYREPAPSGEPVELSTYNAGACGDQLIEGWLRHIGQGSMDIEVWPLDTVAWPTDVAGQRFVSVMWPTGLTGVRTLGGELAVVDASGGLVAMTGRKYRLKGHWVVIQPFGEPFPLPLVLGAFQACGDGSSVIPG